MNTKTLLSALMASAMVLTAPAGFLGDTTLVSIHAQAAQTDADAPAVPKFSTISTGLQNIWPSWKKVSGYEIGIYLNGKWQNVTLTGTKKNFNRLEAHTKYKFRLRSYKTVDNIRHYSDYVTKEFWTDCKLKSDYAYNIYEKKSTSSKVIRYMKRGSVIQRKGGTSGGWTQVYIPGTNKEKTGYIRTNGMHYYMDLNLTPINQNGYAGGARLPLGCEETSLASVLRNQFGFNVTKNQLVDHFMPMQALSWNGSRYTISVDPNYCFWGSPYHSREPDGNGYGVYAPVIAQSAYKYLRSQGQEKNYQIDLHTDYYTGSNTNKLKFDPKKLDLGSTNITGGLTASQIRTELDMGHNVIIWYNVSSLYVSKTVSLRKGGRYTAPGSGTYSFKWVAHQHTAVITGYDNALKRFKVANVYNSNTLNPVGTTYYISYSSFDSSYGSLGRQSVVVYKK